MEIVVNSWKTKKSYSEPRVLALSDDLKKCMRSFVKQRPGQQHLFVDASGNAFKRNSFTKKITRLFKEHFPDKDISTTMLRHIFATEQNGDIVDALEEDAKKLGHSVSTHLQYIKK
jgi:site-specific recombinase XerD